MACWVMHNNLSQRENETKCLVKFKLIMSVPGVSFKNTLDGVKVLPVHDLYTQVILPYILRVK